METNHRIKVIDSYPGSGKTSYAIQHINETHPDTKIIYITPFLDEVDRIIQSCPQKNFYQPIVKLGEGSKMTHLINLVQKGTNIVSTHALFSMIDDELVEALRNNDYVLYLDEAMQTVDRWDIKDASNMSKQAKERVTKQDVETLLAKGIIQIEKDYSIGWVDNERPLSYYERLRKLANRKLLYFVDGNLLLWTFPVEVFREGIFSEIYILTHMFEAQLQAYYYGYFNIEYTKYYVYQNQDRYEIIETNRHQSQEIEWKQDIKSKIHVLDNPKMNRIGDIYYDAWNRPYVYLLSRTWYHENAKRNNPNIQRMRDNIENFFVNITKSKTNQRLWTCFKDDIPFLRSKNVTARTSQSDPQKTTWIPCNSRSTNSFGDRTVLCFPINIFIDPFYEKFFNKRGIYINEDQYALSELMQWLWRSALRNYQDVTIYLPSGRMRKLLLEYFEI